MTAPPPPPPGGPDPRDVKLERGRPLAQPDTAKGPQAPGSGMGKPARKRASTSPAPAIHSTAGVSDFLFGWTRSPKAGPFVLIALGLLGLFLAGLDFVLHRHSKFALEAAYGFYALFGFLAFSFVVLMGWPLRRLLGRPEDYYDPPGSED